MYLRRYLECEPVKVCNELALEKSFECCGIKLPKLQCFIVCIYGTPNSDVSVLLERLQILLHKLNPTPNTKLIIAGDINIDTIQHNTLSDAFRSILLNFNLYLHTSRSPQFHLR